MEVPNRVVLKTFNVKDNDTLILLEAVIMIIATLMMFMSGILSAILQPFPQLSSTLEMLIIKLLNL